MNGTKLGTIRALCVGLCLLGGSVRGVAGDVSIQVGEMQRLVAEVAVRLERAVLADPDCAPDLTSLRLAYAVATEGAYSGNACVMRGPQADAGWPVCLPAHPLGGSSGAPRALGQELTIVVGTRLMTEVCGLSPARVAVVLGHELAHIALGHVTSSTAPRGDSLALADLSREQEHAADAAGVRYAVAAGYANAVSAATDTWLQMGQVYGALAPLEPQAAFRDHPSNLERIAALQTDPALQLQWQAALAFDSGAYYLHLGEWEIARTCFEVVLSSLPHCPEALANLGYAKMMTYYAALPAAERVQLGGEVSCLSFVQRLPVLVRGVADDTPLREAVAHYREAVLLAPGLRAAQAGLGAALLMYPEASPEDLQEASALLAQVAAEATRDAAARDLAADAASNLALARRRVSGDAASFAAFSGPAGLLLPVNELTPAFKANLGVSLAASTVPDDWEQAVRLLTEYLQRTPPGSYYHEVAAQNWALARDKLGLPPADPPCPRAPEWQPSNGVTLPKGERLFLREPWAEARRALEPYQTMLSPCDEALGTFVCLCPELGLSLRVSRETVRALVLQSPAGPPVVLRSDRLGLGARLSLRVGARLRDRAGLGLMTEPLTIGTDSYRLYRQANIALRLDGDTIRGIALVSG